MGFSKLPSNKAFLITPNDDSNLPPVDGEGVTGVSVYVGRGGDIRYNDTSNVTHTDTVSSGQLLDVLANKVFATGTTALDLLGIYKITGVGDFAITEWQSLTSDSWENITPDTWNN